MPTGTAAAVPVVRPAPERRIVASAAAVVFKAAGGGGVGRRRGSRGADADGDDAVLGGRRQLRQPHLRRLHIVIRYSLATH